MNIVRSLPRLNMFGYVPSSCVFLLVIANNHEHSAHPMFPSEAGLLPCRFRCYPISCMVSDGPYSIAILHFCSQSSTCSVSTPRSYRTNRRSKLVTYSYIFW